MGVIFGGAFIRRGLFNIRREICVSESANLVLEGNLRLKVDWASL